MQLSEAQKSALAADGFLHLPGVIPRDRVDSALRAINLSIGQGMNVADMREFAVQSYCPKLRLAPVGFNDRCVVGVGRDAASHRLAANPKGRVLALENKNAALRARR